MMYLKEINVRDSGFEVVYYDENGTEYNNTYETYDEAIAFVTTLIH